MNAVWLACQASLLHGQDLLQPFRLQIPGVSRHRFVARQSLAVTLPISVSSFLRELPASGISPGLGFAIG
jgi:hypothetical protein